MIRNLVWSMLAVPLIAGCASGTDRGASEEASPTPTEAASRSLVVEFVHAYQPYDDSGILRNDDTEGTPCGVSGLTKPTDSLAFMTPSADVLISDGSGRTLAKGTLPAGRATDIAPAPANTFTCTWRTRVSAVPAADFYEVSVGDESLGTVSQSEIGADGVLTLQAAR